MGSPWWKRMLCGMGRHDWWYEPEPFASTAHVPPTVKRGCGTCGRVWRWSRIKKRWQRV